MKDNDSMSAEFEWVKARAECSLIKVFKALELGVSADVEQMDRLFPNVFSIVVKQNQFSVIRIIEASLALSKSVGFALSSEKIIVREGAKVLEAGITLNNKGQCLLKVSEEELEQWQFRKMTLEGLFFGPP